MMNLKMKRVLISIDYDSTAQKVAEVGYAFAKEMKAEVFLVHVVSTYEYYSSTGNSPILGFGDMGGGTITPTITRDELMGETQKYLDKTKSMLGDESIQAIVADGETADTILSIASEVHADIIIMGSHSRRWLDKILMGSVTEKVMRKTKLPLFIVPTKG